MVRTWSESCFKDVLFALLLFFFNEGTVQRMGSSIMDSLQTQVNLFSSLPLLFTEEDFLKVAENEDE